MFRESWKLVKYGGIAMAGIALGSIPFAANEFRANCSTAQTSNWSPSAPANVPEFSPKWDYNWDKREPWALINKKDKKDEEKYSEALEKNKTKVTRHIILIRHGQYNLKGKNDQEHKLTDLGRRQATYSGKRLKELGYKYDKAIVSTMTRAQETAGLILKEISQDGLCKKDEPLIREGAPCLPEPPSGAGWCPSHHEFYEEGAVIEAGFRKLFHRADPCQTSDSYELVICHANVIRYFVVRALQFPPSSWLRMSLNHASITVLSILPSGRVVLRAIGDSGHLPPDMITLS